MFKETKASSLGVGPIQPRMDGVARRGAPRATQDLHPWALIRRHWLLVLTTSLLAAGLLLLMVASLPTRSTAVVQLRLPEPGADLIVARNQLLPPEEQLQALTVDLESPAMLEQAAARASTTSDGIDVVATGRRGTLFLDVAVTAASDGRATDVADAIPVVVAEMRQARVRSMIEEVTEELRARANMALEQAAAVQAEIDELDPPASATSIFMETQRRDALVSQYEQLLTRAAEIELQAPTVAAGFEVLAPARVAPGRFPPPDSQTAVLVAIAGLLIGAGLVIARSVLGGHLYREHLEEASSQRYIGLIRQTRRGPHPDDLRGAAARLRALPDLREPRSLLVSLLCLDSGVSSGWPFETGQGPAPAANGVVPRRPLASSLGAALAESGIDVAALVVTYAADVAPTSRKRMAWADVHVDVVEAASVSPTGARCPTFCTRRFGGSALAAVYSRDTRTIVEGLRADHDLLLVDPTASGVEGWLEAAFTPDLVIVVATEGATSQGRYDDARERLAAAGIPAVTLLVSPRALLRAARPGPAVRGGVVRAPGMDPARSIKGEG